jgi:hypothetical protein
MNENSTNIHMAISNSYIRPDILRQAKLELMELVNQSEELDRREEGVEVTNIESLNDVRCGYCDSTISRFTQGHDYCSNCGTRLIWEEV